MLRISNKIAIPDNELEFSAIRAQGSGGQNINKVSTAIHLRFDIRSSSLPDIYKTRLLKLKDKRISKDGIIIIKAQSSRSQEKNKEDALDRLQAIIRSTLSIRKKRIATKPTRGSQSRRLDQKSKRAKDKVLRKKVETP